MMSSRYCCLRATIAQRVERRLNILREKNILNYFEDLAEGRKLDFVIIQLLKSIAGEEFNLEVAQLVNQLLKKYEKAQKKGCPSAKVFAVVADKFCNFIDAYKLYYQRHSQEAEEYYKRYNEVETDGSENLIRKYIHGEDFTDNISNLKNVLGLFSAKSMNLWFDQWFKKEIGKYGTQDMGEMIQSIDEMLLLREPKIKPINTSFWKAVGEFQNSIETKQEAVPVSDKSSASLASDSIAKNTATDRQLVESTDTDTDELCETILASYIDKKHDRAEKKRILHEDKDSGIYDEHDKSLGSDYLFLEEENEEVNLENVFTQQIKKLVKRYGIVNIKEGLINLGMEKYLYSLQKDIGNVDCVFFAEESNRKECEEFKKDLLRKRKRNKMQRKQDLDKKKELDLYHSADSTSFHDNVEKALSDYPWNLKPKRLHKDLRTMVETLETELMNCSLKHYPVPQPILAESQKSESSMEQILPGWALTKKPNKQKRRIMPLIKKSMEGRMESGQQKLLNNIVFKLILKDHKDISPTELENVFKKFSEGKDAWGPGWNNYGDRLKQLLTETYQQKVLESALEDYKFQENYLGMKDLNRARERFSKFEYTDIPFEDCEIPSSESFSEKKSVASDPFMDLGKQKTKKTGGLLPSMEDLIERKKKIKEYEKKRMESLSRKKDIVKKVEKKVIDCEKEKQATMFPEIESAYKDEPWFKEVYFEERDK